AAPSADRRSDQRAQGWQEAPLDGRHATGGRHRRGLLDLGPALPGRGGGAPGLLPAAPALSPPVPSPSLLSQGHHAQLPPPPSPTPRSLQERLPIFAAPSADGRSDQRAQGWQEAPLDGRHATGGRRRGALRDRCLAWTARGGGSRAHLSAALALSRAFASARFAFARRPLRGDEEAGIRQQSL